MEIKTYIGIAAGILTAISAVPQIIKVLKDKNANDVSPTTYFVLLAGNLMWGFYGLLQEDLPILLTNAFSVVCDITMIILNYRYTKK